MTDDVAHELLERVSELKRALEDLTVITTRILRLQEKIALGLGISLAEQ